LYISCIVKKKKKKKKKKEIVSICLIGSGPLLGSPDFSSEPLPVKEQTGLRVKYLKKLYMKRVLKII
jgi:hypothetical protein